MFKRILVAIDQSVGSQQAFNAGLELTQALSAELLLVHALDVFDPASPTCPQIAADSYSVELSQLSRKAYEREWTEFAQHYDALLTQKRQDAEAMGIKASHLQPYGRPGPAICQAAVDRQADLIIVGSHGRKGLREMLLGSVSNYIMHHAPCSVMVVHPDGHRDDPLEQPLARLATAS
ncbi:universal stress protein [filamentous cyanobacterium CCT1]|nr:universal stress protein [filamentous cyanobacterium CCT1]